MKYPESLKRELRQSISCTLNDMHDIRHRVTPKDFKSLVNHVEELETQLFKSINKGKIERDIKLSIPSFKSSDRITSGIARQLKLNVFKIITNHKIDCI